MTDPSVSRRKFLKTAGIAAGGATLACCGLATFAATQTGTTGPTEPVDTPSYTFGKDQSGMNQPILLAYATRSGSTVGVAEAIGKTLGERGFSVEVKPFKDNPDPSGYSAVVLGSAVNGGQWLPEALTYVTDHQAGLAQIPAALFCVHGMNGSDSEDHRKKRIAYLNAVRKVIPAPAAEAWFLGQGLDPNDTNVISRWAYKLFGGAGEGDLRDWEKINAWAESVFDGQGAG
jgi:menaquinone-dependent protoporphyrinogen oxidase